MAQGDGPVVVKQGFISALLSSLREPTTWIPWLVISVLFTATGTFQTDMLFDIVPRLFFWLVLIGISLLTGVSLRVAVQHLWPATDYLAASFASALLSGIMLALTLPAGVRRLLDVPAEVLPSPVSVMVVITMIGSLIGLFHHFFTQAGGLSGQARPRLLERLPQEICGNLLRISVHDHYVEVATDRGTARLLMRLSDAIGEVDSVDGLRVHRSHWVARSAVSVS